ncbi:MAG: hypothetical protein P1V97_00075 [Planctomycetota bacterium]|nr:hypothetical protein [Planctomycetota bacterium]
MTKKMLAAVLVMAFCGSQSVSADVIPGNVKSVKHTITFTGLKKFKGKKFILSPTNGHYRETMRGGKIKFAVIEEGKPVHFGSHFSPKVYVVDDSFDLKTITNAWFKKKDHIVSKKISRSSFIDRSSPVMSIKTTYELVKIEKKVLVLKEKTTKSNKAGKVIKPSDSPKQKLFYGLPLLTLFAGSFLLSRRKKNAE